MKNPQPEERNCPHILYMDHNTYHSVKLLAYLMDMIIEGGVTIDDVIENALWDYFKKHKNYFPRVHPVYEAEKTLEKKINLPKNTE